LRYLVSHPYPQKKPRKCSPRLACSNKFMRHFGDAFLCRLAPHPAR
jgi:hypothetical protein